MDAKESLMSDFNLDKRNLRPRKSDRLRCHSEEFARVGSWRYDTVSQVVHWSDGMYRIHAMGPDDEDSTIATVIGNVHPDDLVTLTQAMQRSVSRRESGSCLARILRPNGEERTVIVVFEGVHDEIGRLCQILGAVQDITSIKEAEEAQTQAETKVQQAQKLESLGVLAGGIAHDFNNLLAGILGNADLAMMDLEPDAPSAQSIREIQIAARRAADLARQMLAFAGRGRLVIRRLDLNALIESMADLLRTKGGAGEVQYALDPTVAPVEADASQLHQLVLNLAVNAVESLGDDHGVIRLSTGTVECDRSFLNETYPETNREEGYYSFIEVSDTGTGMDESTLARIFDPFFTTKFTGRGLGLAAVMGIVRGHCAAIKVDSEPGKGSTFTVLFPVSGAGEG